MMNQHQDDRIVSIKLSIGDYESESVGTPEGSPPRSLDSKRHALTSAGFAKALKDNNEKKVVRKRIDSPTSVMFPILKSCLKTAARSQNNMAKRPLSLRFLKTAEMARIPSHKDLTRAERESIYWGHDDMQGFVKAELRRRKSLGIKSMSALSPEAEKFD
eukprot:CAMPEP_0172639788 /NCGR_PEP_ID=MMETSP1068-20121228/219916_1 /TAXON_ID=35684 /ORGANISM="Pseudopedinella elastica, Strain CCMP716" /LENGTH=159 /DNA_ID=CAMNT_0013453019 /DNA_START=66 /DNA_END=545 /DNA_ORIENTATION=+